MSRTKAVQAEIRTHVEKWRGPFNTPEGVIVNLIMGKAAASTFPQRTRNPVALSPLKESSDLIQGGGDAYDRGPVVSSVIDDPKLTERSNICQ